MPIVGGILKDGTKVLTEDFFNGNCINPGFPLSFIKAVLESRDWDGMPHVTGLLNGTREQFLKNTSKYFVNLDGMVLAMAGTRLHANLESPDMLSELTVKLAGIQGTMDLLEEVPWLEELNVVDYKLVGSFKLTKWNGISKRPVPVMDNFGNPVLLKTGQNKGKAKMKNEIFINEDAKEQFDYTMQTNIYRVAINERLASKAWQKENPQLEHLFNRKIDHCRVFFVIRDSGINRDFTYKSYLEECEIFDDQVVLDFVASKSKLIIDAMANWKADLESGESKLDAAYKNCPPMCSNKETWGGKKCTDYCDVREACKLMQATAIERS